MGGIRFDENLFNAFWKAFELGGREGVELGFLQLRGKFALPEEEFAAALMPAFLDALIGRRDAEALDIFLEAAAKTPFLPDSLWRYGFHSAGRAERKPDMAEAFFAFAGKACEEGRPAIALEAVKHVYNSALSGRRAEFLLDGKRLVQVAGLHERVAEGFLDREPSAPSGAPKRRPRVALVTINMLENVSAYSKTALQFAKFADRERCEVYEYFTEETLTERKQLFPIKFVQRHSELNAPGSLAAIRATGAAVKFVPTELDWMEASLWLASEMERDAVDAVFFQGGVASPIMWQASRLAKIPAKCTLCVGVNMYQRGQAATVYMSNPANLEKEKAFWKPEWGRQVFLRGGVDLEEAAAALPLRRADYGIPSDAPTFGLLGNYPAQRMTPPYMECVAKVLKRCPGSVFVCLGPGEPEDQKKFLEREGLLERSRWLSWQHKDSFASLKLLDLYFNEFPVGGAQSLLEAMACGVPALAVRWSSNYAESAGAEIAGPDFSMSGGDLDAYVERAVALLSNEEARRQAAAAQTRRVGELYSARSFVRNLCELGLELAKA